MNLNTYKQITNAQKTGLLDKLSRVISPKQKAAAEIRLALDVENELVDLISEAKREWENACANFEYASEDDVVDYYTYKIKAAQIRYEYYIKKAKALGIKFDGMDIKI